MTTLFDNRLKKQSEQKQILKNCDYLLVYSRHILKFGIYAVEINKSGDDIVVHWCTTSKQIYRFAESASKKRKLNPERHI